MSSRVITGIGLAVAGVILLGVEVNALVNPALEDTISEITVGEMETAPAIALAGGALIGHFASGIAPEKRKKSLAAYLCGIVAGMAFWQLVRRRTE